MNYEAARPRNTPLVDVAGMAAFVAVINAASFTGAARLLGTSKSVISRRISSMELQLGTQLIDRTAVKVSATEVGAAYYERCLTILESIEAANDLVASFHGGIRGGIRVLVPRFYGAHVLAPLLAAFASNYPEVKVDIDLDERDANLNDTGFDLAIRIGRLANSSMLAKTIAASRSWICASPDYLSANGTPQSPDDLEHHDCLVSSGGEAPTGWQLQVNGETRAFRVRERMRSACCFQLLAAARSGLGLALLPGYAIADTVSAGKLKVVLPAYAPSASPVSVVYPSSRKMSRKVQTLIGFLAEQIPVLPAWKDVDDAAVGEAR